MDEPTLIRILKKVSLTREAVPNYNYEIIKPVSLATKGDFYCYQLYDKVQPYLINGKPNVPGSMGYQHIIANRFKKDVWQIHLIPTWNFIAEPVKEIVEVSVPELPIEIIKEEPKVEALVPVKKDSGFMSFIMMIMNIIISIFSKKK